MNLSHLFLTAEDYVLKIEWILFDQLKCEFLIIFKFWLISVHKALHSAWLISNDHLLLASILLSDDRFNARFDFCIKWNWLQSNEWFYHLQHAHPNLTNIHWTLISVSRLSTFWQSFCTVTSVLFVLKHFRLMQSDQVKSLFFRWLSFSQDVHNFLKKVDTFCSHSRHNSCCIHLILKSDAILWSWNCTLNFKHSRFLQQNL